MVQLGKDVEKREKLRKRIEETAGRPGKRAMVKTRHRPRLIFSRQYTAFPSTAQLPPELRNRLGKSLPSVPGLLQSSLKFVGADVRKLSFLGKFCFCLVWGNFIFVFFV